MNLNLLIKHLLGLMFCACLPIVSIMAAAMANSVPGFISDLGTGSEQSNVPMINRASQRWDLLKIQAPEAWRMASGGQNAVVAVLDTGIDDIDNSLKGKVIGRAIFTTSTGPDANGHGTFIAGLIAGTADNSGIAGLAYNSCLLDVKVAENDGTSDAKKVAQGILWAADHGANVINISIAIDKPYTLLEYAVDYAWRHGCVIVAAAGNSDSDEPVYPAAYPQVIGVAATDKNDCLAEWSNKGDWVSIAAPGVNIYSTLPDEGSGFKSGTSFSTALVSGEAALLFPRVVDNNDNGQVNDEVRNMILTDSDDLKTPDSQMRRINIYDAAKAAEMLVKE